MDTSEVVSLPLRSLKILADKDTVELADNATSVNATYTCDSFSCYDTSLSGESLLQSLWLNVCFGALLYFVFVAFRKIPNYTARLTMPGIKHRPPPVRLGGHWQLWSWLQPVFKVSDRELLRSAGFDALVVVRITAFGVALFAPTTFFGLVVLVPVNYLAGGYYEEQVGAEAAADLTYGFMRTSISNIDHRSSLLWIHFVFLVAFVAWTSFLLLNYYDENIAMRQTLLGLDLQELKKEALAFEKAALLGDVQTEETDLPPSTEPLLGNKNSNSKGVEAPIVDAKGTVPTINTTTTDAATTTDLEAGGVGDSMKTSPSGGDTIVGEDGEVVKVLPPIEGSSDLRLWPVPPTLTGPMPSRPLHAGIYSVLVVDEPTHRFSVARRGTVRLGRSTTLLKAQTEADQEANAYWLEETRHSSKVAINGEGSGGGSDPEAGVALGDQNGNGNENDSESGYIDLALSTTLPNTSIMTNFFRAQATQGTVDEEELEDEVELRLRVVDSTFRRLFGDDFDRVVPLYDTRKADAALTALYKTQCKAENLEASVAAASAKGNTKKVAKLEALVAATSEKEALLRDDVATATNGALDSVPCQSFLAIFHTATAAAQASSLDLNPVNWRAFHLAPGVDPENLNWHALQRPFRQRSLRSALMMLPLLLIMAFPIGMLTGLFSQLGNTLCTEGSIDLTGTWFCEDGGAGEVARSFLTGNLPSLLMTLYQSVILAKVVYAIAQAESRHFTLNDLDMRCGTIYFLWNVIVFFLGALLGGTIFSGLQAAIDDPSQIWTILGTAIPGSSLFFVNYVMVRALFLSFLRLFMPHMSALMAALRSIHLLPAAKTERAAAALLPPRNFRLSRDIGIMFFSIFICALSFSVICPIILPFALIYFFIMYCVMRYQVLYCFQPAYDSRGLWWPWTAHRILVCLGLMVVFTCAMLYVKGAYIQATIALFLLLGWIIGFSKYLASKYDTLLHSTPVALLEAAPRVTLDEYLYTPPPLRPGAQGWYPEWGKAWQYWGAPRYGI